MAPSLKPLGLSTERLDQPQLQARLQLQLRIPTQSVDKTKPEDRTEREDEGRAGGWSRQESVVLAQGDLQSGRDSWRRFQSGTGRRSNFGAIQIDGPSPKKTLTPTTVLPEASGPWTTIDRWHGRAARFEEWGRKTAEQMGSDPALDLDPQSPVPRTQGGQSKRRRRYRLA